MKYGLLALCFSVVLLAACSTAPSPEPPAPATPEQPAVTETTPTQPSLPPPSEKSEYPTPGEPDRTAFDFPTDVQEIFDNAQVRAGGGITYTYLKTENSIPSSDVSSEAVVYQKGAVMKLVFNEDQVLAKVGKRELFYDEAVLNLEDHSIQAYCTDTKNCRGDTGERSVSFDDVIFPTPMYWYENMQAPKKTGQSTIDGRSVYFIDATVKGDAVTVAVDRYSGVPVQVTDGTTVYQYQKFALGVTDAQLKP